MNFFFFASSTVSILILSIFGITNYLYKVDPPVVFWVLFIALFSVMVATYTIQLLEKDSV